MSFTSNVQSALTTAIGFNKDGRYNETLSLCDLALKNKNISIEDRCGLYSIGARAYKYLGMFDQARNACLTALKDERYLKPSSRLYLYEQTAKIYLQRREYESSADFYEKAIRCASSPKDKVHYWHYKIGAIFQAKQPNRALATASDAIKYGTSHCRFGDPSVVDFWRIKADIFFHLGDCQSLETMRLCLIRTSYGLTLEPYFNYLLAKTHLSKGSLVNARYFSNAMVRASHFKFLPEALKINLTKFNDSIKEKMDVEAELYLQLAGTALDKKLCEDVLAFCEEGFKLIEEEGGDLNFGLRLKKIIALSGLNKNQEALEFFSSRSQFDEQSVSPALRFALHHAVLFIHLKMNHPSLAFLEADHCLTLYQRHQLKIKLKTLSNFYLTYLKVLVMTKDYDRFSTLFTIFSADQKLKEDQEFKEKLEELNQKASRLKAH